jgi:hypothetical protein
VLNASLRAAADVVARLRHSAALPEQYPGLARAAAVARLDGRPADLGARELSAPRAALAEMYGGRGRTVPLRCLDPIRDILAFDLSPDEWRTLELENRKARHLRMPCCSSQVTLKRSARGTQFFAHKAGGDCSTAPETEAHRRLKRMAVEAARADGWTVATEVSGRTPRGEHWKADVLAERGDHKVAVEIQWSQQSNDETLRRQKRYAESEVRGLWLLRHPSFPVTHDLPAACISGSLEEAFAALLPTGSEEQSLPMQEFLAAAFSKRLRFGVPIGFAATVSIRAGHMFCWSCGCQTRIITGIDVAFGPNRYGFSVPDLWGYPDLFEIVLGRLPDDLGLGAIKRRFSKTQGRSYLSNGCAHCDRIIGENYEHDAWEDQATVCAFPIRLSERWQEAIEGNVGYEDGWAVYSIADRPK